MNDQQEEFVIIGRGVGFNKKKGDFIQLNDTMKKYPMNYTDQEQKILDIVNEIPTDLFLKVEDTIEGAQKILKTEFDYPFVFTIASHIYYSLKRSENIEAVALPFDYGLDYIFPNEYEAAKWSVKYLKEKHGLNLSEHENVFLTFHFVNGMEGRESKNNVIDLGKIISGIIEIIEKKSDITLDKDSTQFSRFVIHLRYFLIRQYEGKTGQKQEFEKMMTDLAVNFKEANDITEEIVKFLEDKSNYNPSYEENLYLLLHVQRLIDEKR